MKKFQKLVAVCMLFCMLITLLPPIRISHAAEVIRQYELDTDGIDPGATYLILNTAAVGSSNALMGNTVDFKNQTVTVQQNENGTLYVASGFDNEESCQMVFSAASTGTIRWQNYYMDLPDSKFNGSAPSETLTFAQQNNGSYRISCKVQSWFITRTYYLRFNNNDWADSTQTSNVYLYKMVEYVVSYNVTFDGNGYTSGALPQNELSLDYGTTYTVPTPSADLRKDVGEDTWLFRCWNTKPDGTGTEYAPGETIYITEDVTLYADWYQQIKYEATVIINLDGERTDIEALHPGVYPYIRLDGSDGDYIPLKHRQTGVYGVKVVENGLYSVYVKHEEDGTFEEAHGHKVAIYNQDGVTELLNYSVSYDANGGVWAEGQEPETSLHHANTPITAVQETPTMTGHRFLGWQVNGAGPLLMPGSLITQALLEKTVLSAQWEKNISVTVKVRVNHTPVTGGSDGHADRHMLQLRLRQVEGDVNIGFSELLTLNPANADWNYAYDEATNITTYSYTFHDLPQNIYDVAVYKSHYDSVVTQTGNRNEDQVVEVDLTFSPDSFDFDFDVQVNFDETTKALVPEAVNLRVLFWNGTTWQVITQQSGTAAPVSVELDENGRGTGFFPVWKYWAETGETLIPYVYRVMVSSFRLPDGTVVRAAGTDFVDYYMTESGLYTANVQTTDGKIPTYPQSTTSLYGAYYDASGDDEQCGRLLVTVDIHPMTVTLDAGAGTLEGQNQVVLQNQYRYPDLQQYVAVPNDTKEQFAGWELVEGSAGEAGGLLTGNVTYRAVYTGNMDIFGKVVADSKYEMNDEELPVDDPNLIRKVMVLLQKNINGVYNDVAAQIVQLTYPTVDGEVMDGWGTYRFEDIPNDGTEYRIQVLGLNYTSTYDNNDDYAFQETEYTVLADRMTLQSKVDIHLNLKPEEYQQGIVVDASLIEEGMRPTNALVKILYRDLGDVHHYQVIAQHKPDNYGVEIEIDRETAQGIGYQYVWNWHTNSTLYEYQAQLAKVYGSVEGAYTPDGTDYTADLPYTVRYGPANNLMQQLQNDGVMLQVTLVPKEFPVLFDLNLGTDKDTPVLGMDDYMVDDGTGNERYVHMHTWSFAESIEAFPYREGYVFTGWESSDKNSVVVSNDGYIEVGYAMSGMVTLTATWEKLQGTDYTVRHLELNTDKVLHGAQMVTGAQTGSSVMAVEKALVLQGYEYAGAMVGGAYYDKTQNPKLTVTEDPLKNLMVIYYLPDGSDGYTEQVESNLSISKSAVLKDDGTYTITMDTYTKDNPITTLIEMNTPLDIVLVLDQSGSLAENNFEYLQALQSAVDSLIETVANHGRINEVDHRIALVGFAGNASDAHSSDPVKATGGKETDSWINTGVFDSNGEFHLYNVKGFNYTLLEDTADMNADGIYYTKVERDGQEKYLLLTYHEEYRHLISEEQARLALLEGQVIYGYAFDENGRGEFVELTRNTSGLWLYGDKQLYSAKEFFTYHTDVWTHREGLGAREIHAYGVGANYKPSDGHEGVYTREETTGNSYEQDIFVDALVPVSIGDNGSGGTYPGLLTAAQNLGADGATRAGYGMEMANKVLAANPPDEDENRVRMVLLFTDGEPGYMGFDASSGQDYYDQAVTEANKAISEAYIAKNTHDAYVYAIGLYESDDVEVASEVGYYMNALSSNYPNAKSMDDIKTTATYEAVGANVSLISSGKHYVKSGNNYYQVKYGNVRTNNSWSSQYQWYFTAGTTNYRITTTTSAKTNNNSQVGNYTIYEQSGGYLATEHSGYYSATDSTEQLEAYFQQTLRDITTKITTEVVLYNDTILRDIMGQGLVLTPGTEITAYKLPGTYNAQNNTVTWADESQMTQVAYLKIPENPDDQLFSKETFDMMDEYGNPLKEGVPYISVYNLQSANPTDPNNTEVAYHPHTVDVSGYDFTKWYISKDNPNGYKMIVTITRVEATDDVEWSRVTQTNNEQSGLWMPADEQGNRRLLQPFKQPSTIFVERAYVLDYGKSFKLSGWYFDDEDGKNATAVHLDCDIESGMNWFDKPVEANGLGTSQYGNTKYGNVRIDNGDVIYTPVSMNWGDYDEFYVFGDTWRKTVLAQDANYNGNLWNKVTVIPANNIYYEDSFVTGPTDGTNNIQGFQFTGSWQLITGEGYGQNTETPEHQEDAPYGDVHGWTDSLGDDFAFTDGGAHGTGLGEKPKEEIGAQATFTFTGTGVDVYTRTNAKSGMVVAALRQVTENADGTTSLKLVKSLAMDNLSVSGEYYHIPTVSFHNLVYGTYELQLIATLAGPAATGSNRYEYYVDGVRVYNPLGSTTNYADDIVKEAYGLETNAVFTEVRDVLLDYGDFNSQLPNDTEGKMGAVFIDWIQENQGTGADKPGIGQPTYEVGTFETYGPKNEVYLSAGQAIVLKVDPNNTYYVGLKSLKGDQVTANISGITQADPTQIQLSHTTDMYYRVTPVDGYIVIQNGDQDGSILSVTQLRTTNLQDPVKGGGIQSVTPQQAVLMMRRFSALLQEPDTDPDTGVTPPTEVPEEPEQPVEPGVSLDELTEATRILALQLFGAVRSWLVRQ